MNKKELNNSGNNPETINIPVWWSNGGGSSYRRDCLPASHPEHTYNYIKNTLNLKPEDYGIIHPHMEEYGDWSKEELMGEIWELKQQLKNVEQFL